MSEGREVRVPWRRLKEFARLFFTRTGFPEEDAEISADALIQANLRGIDSHGVLGILRYLGQIREGVINPRPEIRVVRESPATAVVDAALAFGPVVSVQAMKKAMDKARNTGIGWVLIQHTAHQGALYYYPLMAAQQDMIGITMTTARPNTAPWGGTGRGVGNNPLCFAAPAKTQRPLILDMATSVVAFGKLVHALEKGEPIPQEWALSPEGTPTTDPADAWVRGGALQPFGTYKGSGLSIMIEATVGLLAGNPLVAPILFGERGGADRRAGQSSVVAAIDIAAFTDVERFKEEVDRLITGVKATRKAPWAEEIFVPGEIEWRTLDERSREGIPLHENVLKGLREVATQLEIPFPF